MNSWSRLIPELHQAHLRLHVGRLQAGPFTIMIIIVIITSSSSRNSSSRSSSSSSSSGTAAGRSSALPELSIISYDIIVHDAMI